MSSQLLSPPEAFRRILESLPSAVYLVDRDRRIVFWNDGCERITGYLRHEVIGRCCAEDLLMHCDDVHDVLCGAGCPLVGTMRDGRPCEAGVYLRHRDGHRVPVRVRAVPVRDEGGAVVGACECFDLRTPTLPSAASAATAQIAGSLDDVTGLPGRAAILHRVEQELQQLRAVQRPFAVLCLGVDHGDELRAVDGATGLNQVLYTTGQTLAASLGAGYLVGRWSDRKFVAVLRGATGERLLESAVFLQRLAGLDSVPWWGDRLTITLSVAGTAARPEDTAEGLLQRAEDALEECTRIDTNRAVVV